MNKTLKDKEDYLSKTIEALNQKENDINKLRSELEDKNTLVQVNN